MLNFKSLTGGVATTALVAAIGLAYAQTTVPEPPAEPATSTTPLPSETTQPEAIDRSLSPDTSAATQSPASSIDSTTPSATPTQSSAGSSTDDFEREPRADRN